MYLFACGCFLASINIITEVLHSKVHVTPGIHGPSLTRTDVIKYVKNKLVRQ